ncbi:retrovirus-related Pol polyprotein from transposon 412 [Trichonephila clavipes]|uniref:Retrovirus-related Pol polyprotein from transposon 412 n=1 Tax=Trichonephila clavipes TaxID=2585209 RepID=A0A8X6VIS0_TRICX|nr:retrovirus-related Pol polyprotein from transposon 412 [Trichonephila clavipes]
MCGMTWKSVVARVIPVLHAKELENTLEEDCNCIIVSSSTLDLTIRGPSTTAFRPREKLRFCSLQETVKYSPSTKPGQQLYILSLTACLPPDSPLVPEEYIEKLQAQMEEMHYLAQERIGMASEKMKTRYDAKITGRDFHEGDKVWLWNLKPRKGLSPKLQTN